jgi:hypothetical protein
MRQMHRFAARFRLLMAGLVFESMELENLDFSQLESLMEDAAEGGEETAATALDDEKIRELIGTRCFIG